MTKTELAKAQTELEKLTQKMNSNWNDYLVSLEEDMRGRLGGDIVQKCLTDFHIKDLDGIAYSNAMETLYNILMMTIGEVDYEVSPTGYVKFQKVD